MWYFYLLVKGVTILEVRYSSFTLLTIVEDESDWINVIQRDLCDGQISELLQIFIGKLFNVREAYNVFNILKWWLLNTFLTENDRFSSKYFRASCKELDVEIKVSLTSFNVSKLEFKLFIKQQLEVDTIFYRGSNSYLQSLFIRQNLAKP